MCVPSKPAAFDRSDREGTEHTDDNNIRDDHPRSRVDNLLG